MKAMRWAAPLVLLCCGIVFTSIAGYREYRNLPVARWLQLMARLRGSFIILAYIWLMSGDQVTAGIPYLVALSALYAAAVLLGISEVILLDRPERKESARQLRTASLVVAGIAAVGIILVRDLPLGH